MWYQVFNIICLHVNKHFVQLYTHLILHCMFNNIQDLKQHLHTNHQIEMKETNHNFSSFKSLNKGR